MKFYVGQRVLIKDITRIYSREFDEFLRKTKKGKIIKIDENDKVHCTVCGEAHSPQITVRLSDSDNVKEWAFTPCELTSLKDRVNKLLEL